MIKLDTQYVTENQTLVGGAIEQTVTTDTLYISQFAIDLNAKSMSATVEQGTLMGGVFQSNLPVLVVSATFDGQITLSNGKNAALPTAAVTAFVSTVAASLDQFVLASGLVGGTIE